MAAVEGQHSRGCFGVRGCCIALTINPTHVLH